MKGPFAGIILILVGAAILASNLGYVNINLTHLLRTWWPLILIALGASYLVSPKR